jgi:hypothetical protein
MEISALSLSTVSGYPQRPVEADAASRAGKRAQHDAQTAGNPAVAGNTSQAKPEATRKDAREARPVQDTKPATTTSAQPHFQFKDVQGTRVMEVFDNKDVLIYQVPPKGQLTLIQTQGKPRASQVETQA